MLHHLECRSAASFWCFCRGRRAEPPRRSEQRGEKAKEREREINEGPFILRPTGANRRDAAIPCDSIFIPRSYHSRLFCIVSSLRASLNHRARARSASSEWIVNPVVWQTTNFRLRSKLSLILCLLRDRFQTYVTVWSFWLHNWFEFTRKRKIKYFQFFLTLSLSLSLCVHVCNVIRQLLFFNTLILITSSPVFDVVLSMSICNLNALFNRKTKHSSPAVFPL